MVVPLGVEAYGEEVLGELTSLGQAVDNFEDFEVDPLFSSMRLKGVFEDEVFWGVG